MHKDIWGYALLAFIGWVIITANAMTRIERACAPVGWGANVLTSVTALALPSQQKPLQELGDRLEYGCRFTIWRLLYQKEYNDYLAAGGMPAKSESSQAVQSATQPEKAQDPVAAPNKGAIANPDAPDSKE